MKNNQHNLIIYSTIENGEEKRYKVTRYDVYWEIVRNIDKYYDPFTYDRNIRYRLIKMIYHILDEYCRRVGPDNMGIQDTKYAHILYRRLCEFNYQMRVAKTHPTLGRIDEFVDMFIKLEISSKNPRIFSTESILDLFDKACKYRYFSNIESWPCAKERLYKFYSMKEEVI